MYVHSRGAGIYTCLRNGTGCPNGVMTTRWIPNNALRAPQLRQRWQVDGGEAC